MGLADDAPDESAPPRAHTLSGATPRDERLAALEGQVAALSAEVAALRDAVRPAAPSDGTGAIGVQPPFVSSAVAEALRKPPSPVENAPQTPTAGWGRSDRMHAGHAMSGVELESLVGRYGTLLLAALVILMAVGALIKMAVQHGLLTPEVRVVAGVVVAMLLAAAGIVFRSRGDVRYGGVLLALSLAVVDLVAWGAGPRFNLVPVGVALGVVDVVALGLVALSLRDHSEFLFVVAIAGALSAPFVTTDGGGTALALLLYGGIVLAGALRSAQDSGWMRAFAALVLGALVYSLAAAALPMSGAWYGPFLVALFGGTCAVAALLFGEPAWRSELPRAYLAVSIVGVLTGWDAVVTQPHVVTISVALGLAVVTYAALLTRQVTMRCWTASALVLPLASLGIAYAGAGTGEWQGAALALWCVFALAAWRVELAASEGARAGAHLLAAGVLGCFAVTAWFWSTPLAFVAGLATWAVVLAALARSGSSLLPLGALALALGAAALSSIDQLASRSAFSYTPFATRSSASALVAALGIRLAGDVIGSGAGRSGRIADRPLRLGVLFGFLIVWGRMEMAQAFSSDLASFLLTSYYAACGVGSIIVGRRLGMGRLRVAGLGLALYAAFKAVVEVTDIGSIMLRVGAYAAVGVFLLSAGYLYREVRARETGLLD